MSQVAVPEEFNVTEEWEIKDNFNEWKACLTKGSLSLSVHVYFDAATLEEYSCKQRFVEKIGRYFVAHPMAVPPAPAAPPAAMAAGAPPPAIPGGEP